MQYVSTDILLTLGGVGLFLVGMVLLTDGLRALSGDALRRFLARSTTTPLAGAATGALTTAIIQSSSATTVTAISFVGAGLLTFPQALGIVFGANIGTTITGWIVALVGFKLKLGTVALPMILAGALLRLFGRRRFRFVGWAIAGFGLLFFGIEATKQGMEHLEGVVTPESFPGDTLIGRAQLVLIGIAITLVTQSSSAGVAIALVALSAGSVSISQAAAMVIGMDIGTTFKAALATVGGSIAVRQTGLGQVIYNLITGVMAFVILDPFLGTIQQVIDLGEPGNAQIALVAFHTTFNTIGVLLIIPAAKPFGRLIQQIVPEHGPPLTRSLDDRLLHDPASATAAATTTVQNIAMKMARLLSAQLKEPSQTSNFEIELRTIDEALETTLHYLGRIQSDPAMGAVRQRHLAAMHAVDHLIRLAHRCKQTARIDVIMSDPELRSHAATLNAVLNHFQDGISLETWENQFDQVRSDFRNEHYSFRDRAVDRAAQHLESIEITLRKLDGIRWLHRVAYHLWRIAHHLRVAHETDTAPPEKSDIERQLEESD